MPSISKKPRHQIAVKQLRDFLGTNSRAVVKQLGLLECDQSYDDVEFLMELINHPQMAKCVTIMDFITQPNINGDLINLPIPRPTEPELRNCLDLLSEVWSDLENLVLHSDESHDSSADELYDLLADISIRQVLVACDDIANYRYEDCVDLETSFLTIYDEKYSSIKEPTEEMRVHNSSGIIHVHPVSSTAPVEQHHEQPEGQRNSSDEPENPLMKKGRVKDLASKFMEKQQLPQPLPVYREKPKKTQPKNIFNPVQDDNRNSNPYEENEQNSSSADFLYSERDAREAQLLAQERYERQKAQREEFFLTHSQPRHVPPPPPPEEESPVETPSSHPKAARRQSLEIRQMVPSFQPNPQPRTVLNPLVQDFPKTIEEEPSLIFSDSALEPTSSVSADSGTPMASFSPKSYQKAPMENDDDQMNFKPQKWLTDSVDTSNIQKQQAHRHRSPTPDEDNDADILGTNYRQKPLESRRRSSDTSREEPRQLEGYRPPYQRINSQESDKVSNGYRNITDNSMIAGNQQQPNTFTNKNLSARNQLDNDSLGTLSKNDGTLSGSRSSTLQRGRRGQQPGGIASRKQSIEESLLPNPGQPRKVVLRREYHGENLGFTIIIRPEDEVSTLQPGFSSMNLSSKQDSKKNLPPKNEIVIQRIMSGSLSDREGTLFPGDVILEFNGQPVSSLDQIRSLIQNSVSLMECQLIVKAPNRGMMRAHLVYIRTFFAYDPGTDLDLPTGDVGLGFRPYEVLELVNAQDLDWWQVRKLSDSSGKARLIPSLQMEERRQAQNTAAKKKKSITKLFRAADSSQKQDSCEALLVRSDLWIYEEVVPWPPYTLPVLLMIGPNGVGKRNLKNLLVLKDPKRFAVPITDTTDQKLEHPSYRLLPTQKMLEDIKAGKYVEWGSIGNEHYGIRYSAIREIISTGRTAILDCQISTVHLLHQPEFNPYVIFIAAPQFEVVKDMQMKGIEGNLTPNKRTDDELRNIVEESNFLSTRYRHLYAQKLINDDMNASINKISHLAQKLCREPGWIPAGWAYELSCPQSKNTDYLPGSSNLHALGIHQLPAGDRSSIIARSVLSGISGYSEESAARMARPPSIVGSQLAESDLGGSINRRLYEKKTRNKPSAGFQPLTPMTEVSSPYESMSDMTHSFPRLSNNSIEENPAHMTAPTARRNDLIPQFTTQISANQRLFSNNKDSEMSSSSLYSSRPDPVTKPAHPGRNMAEFKKLQSQDEQISSTSSEES